MPERPAGRNEAPVPERRRRVHAPLLIPSLALTAALTFAACGSDEPTAVDTGGDAVPAASDSPAEQVVTGRPDEEWTEKFIEDGRATSVEEIYTP